MSKLSVVLATYNEEKYIRDCLEAVRGIADEIIVVDGYSTDNTRAIAKKLGAKVIKVKNQKIFHINKQKALEAAKSSWILQLDADEIVSRKLADEIQKVTNMNKKEIHNYQNKLEEKDLFSRHTKIVEARDGKVGEDNGEYAGFFVSRLNYFLGKYLKYGGVYPDGVIRLVRKDKAYFPAKDVHEQIVVKGKVGWLAHPILHMADISFSRYLKRNSRYIDLIVDDMKNNKLHKNFKNSLTYFLAKPLTWFFKTQIYHKGILDGWQGIVFSFFSAMRFPRAYWRYLTK